MSASPRFGLLGPVRAWRDGRSLALGPPQQRLVLAALLLARRRLMSTDQLIEAVWGDDPPRTALTTLRTYISRLRVVLGESTVVSAGGGYAITDGDLDVATAEELAAAAQLATDDHERYSLLTRAVELWTDEPLSGLTGEFAAAQRDRLTEYRLTIVERLLDVRLELGDPGGVVSQLTPLCGEYPFRERLRALLMLALHRAGRRGEALATYEDLRTQLAEQLGIDPGAAITGLYRRIRSSDANLTPAVPAAGRTTQLPRPAQLPADIGDFNGRADVADTLPKSIMDGTHRLVSVSGVGGVGKTTLALRVAHLIRESFPDGQLYADLRGVEPEPSPPSTVLARFLRALGIDGQLTPDEAEERAALFRSIVADKRMLIVLDNAADAAQVRPLLPGSPHCAVLVTSRSKLTELAGAHRVDVDVLEPDEALALFRSIVGEQRFSRERAAAMDVVAACGFLPLAVRIAAARLTSRAQWSIENLASRLTEQRRRLRELRSGDQTVAATFALSYRQLDEDRARAFRLLAVPELEYLGPDEIAAILRVDRRRAEDLADALANLSLVEVPAPDRYRFHDLVRLFGTQQASPHEPGQALQRLLDHFLAVACAAATALALEVVLRLRHPRVDGGPAGNFADRDAAAAWLDAESPRMLLALRQSIRSGAGDLGIAAELLYVICDWSQDGANRRLFIEVARAVAEAAAKTGDIYAEARSRLCLTDTLVFWYPRDAFAEADRVRELALRLDDDLMYAEATMLLADALANANTGSLPEMLTLMDEAAGRVDDRPGSRDLSARADSKRALALARLGEIDRALDLSARAVPRMRRLNSATALARALLIHMRVLTHARRNAAAIEVGDEALRLARTVRDRPLQMLVLWRLTSTHLEAGNLTETVAFAELTIVVSDTIGDDYKHAQSLVLLAQALWGLGHHDRARACLTDALASLTRHHPTEAEQALTLLDVYSGREQKDGIDD